VPGPWLTDQEVRDRLAAILQLQGGAADLDPFWDESITRGHSAAWKAIRSILVGRGYTAVQLDSWDERKEYESDIAAAWILRDGAADQTDRFPRQEGDNSDYEVPADVEVTIRHLDRRAELYTLTLVDGNGAIIAPLPVDPAVAALGGVGHGSLSEAGDFLPLGTPTRRPCPDQLELAPRVGRGVMR